MKHSILFTLLLAVSCIPLHATRNVTSGQKQDLEQKKRLQYSLIAGSCLITAAFSWILFKPYGYCTDSLILNPNEADQCVEVTVLRKCVWSGSKLVSSFLVTGVTGFFGVNNIFKLLKSLKGLSER